MSDWDKGMFANHLMNDLMIADEDEDEDEEGDDGKSPLLYLCQV